MDRIMKMLKKWNSTNNDNQLSNLLTDEITRLGPSCNIQEYLNQIDSQGNTLLHLAVQKQNIPVIRLLLNFEVDTEIENHKGESPIKMVDKEEYVIPSIIKTMVKSCWARYRLQKQNGSLNHNIFQTSQPSHVQCTSPIFVLNSDISNGRERFPIKCVSDTRNMLPPQDFVYVTKNIFSSSLPDLRPANFDPCKDCLNGDCRNRKCTCCTTTTTHTIHYDKSESLEIEHFLNPLSQPYIFECNQLCSCNPIKCVNRVVQRGSDIPLCVVWKGCKGWGVHAQSNIVKGAFVVEYVGEYLNDLPDGEDDSYVFRLCSTSLANETGCVEIILDAARYGNVARFINHSCKPNLSVQRVFTVHQDFKYPLICLFALRDIYASEELTFDYGENFWNVKNKEIACKCQEKTCKYSTIAQSSYRDVSKY